MSMQQSLTQLGRLTGSLALLCFAIALVTSVRVPSIERIFGGLDRQYRAHHVAGVVAFTFMIAHPLALAAAALHNSPHDAALVFFPAEMSAATLLGWGALLAAVVVAVTSFLDSLPHRAWHVLHTVAWPMVGAAFVHSVMYAPPTPFAYAIYAAAIITGVALLARLGGAIAPRHRFLYAVRSVRHPLPGITEVNLVPQGRPIAFTPGQFVFARFFDERIHWRCTEYHPFTIASPPSPDRALTLIIKSLGDCTARLQFLESGAFARIEGPFGTLFAHVPAQCEQVWVGGGVGIAPFLSKAQALTETSPRIDFYYCARSLADAAYLADFQHIAARLPQFRVLHVLEDRDGVIRAEVIASQSGPPGSREYLLCGPPAMVHTLVVDLQRIGVPHSQIHHEAFDFV